ncbi:MAG TPA: hypothetical protein PK445_09540 [Methanolinea sp.]|nr:hypothetical protein [Methanolinea sp.]
MLREKFEKIIKNKILNILYLNDEYDIYLVSSARSAIFCFFNSIKNKKSVVLIPNYVCNVIYKAIEETGVSQIVLYDVTDNLLPNLQDLKNKNDIFRPDIILFAPIFGAYSKEFINIMKITSEFSNRPKIFLDFAQDFDAPIPKFVDIGVSTFNKKTINGFFGGILIIKKKDYSISTINLEHNSIKDELQYLKLLISMFISSIIDKRNKNNFSFNDNYDYSYCKYFPYTINNFSISIVSILYNLLALSKFYSHRKIRTKNFYYINQALNNIEDMKIIIHERTKFSPFIPIIIKNKKALKKLKIFADKNKILIKNPYSKPNNKDESFKNYLFALENPFKKLF